MSEVGKIAEPAPEPTLFEQTGELPEATILPTEPAETAPAEEIKIEEKKPEPAAEPPKKKSIRVPIERFDAQTKARRDAERRAEAAEARLAALEPRVEGDVAPAFKPEQFEQLIDQRAQALLAAKETEKRAKGFLEAGEKEFGREGFQEKCNEVAALGAGDSREFMALVTDPDVLPDGHKIVAALADNPDEAQRILALEPMKMAAALTRFATTTKPVEQKISNAPAPIRPVGGTAKQSEPTDNEDIKSWMAKRNAQARVSAGGKPNSR